uniref:F-box domain-containing protein n=1 Tax=Panagrolaimus sp. PS1159 TaxID=55785 RepID=A0AC35FK21_9BILA
MYDHSSSSSYDKNSGKNIKCSYLPLTPNKKRKAFPNIENSLPTSSDVMDIESLANEVMINIFKFLARKELDHCAFVNKRWNDIIRVHQQKFARRIIDKLSIYAEECNPTLINFWACSLASTMQRHFVLDLSATNVDPGIIQILKFSKVKCLVLGTINLTEGNIQKLLTIFQKADVIIMEMQMRRVNVGNITASGFHEFCEKINAKRYGFSEMLQAENEHFGNAFFNKKIFGEAKYLFIKEISSDETTLHINVDDDILIDFIFGKNNESVERKVLSLHFPSISSDFVSKVLNRFENEPDISHMVTEVNLTACADQAVLRYPQYQNIILRYANYISYNAAADKELQAEIKKDHTGLVNVFLSIGKRY